VIDVAFGILTLELLHFVANLPDDLTQPVAESGLGTGPGTGEKGFQAQTEQMEASLLSFRD
jgi:hypothetical protein